MSRAADPPEGLEAFQARFSAMLRTPLDRSTGTLRDQPALYPSDACADALPTPGRTAAERLAAYNRQYWFRLFDVLQHEHRLTTRLLGAWSFNELAARFLEAHAPASRDLACAADGFATFLDTHLPLEDIRLVREQRSVPRRALLQAARIDDAFCSVFRAPQQQPFAPTAADAERLEHGRLQWSRAVRLVEEDWPLLALREQAGDEQAIALPDPHATTRHWAICRTTEGQRVVPLEPLAAKLMYLLYDHPLGTALAQLEQQLDQWPESAPAASLAAQTQRWLSEGVRHGFWTGIAS